MTTKTIENLEAEIEQVVRKHLAAYRSAASAAVEQAFSSASSPPRRGGVPGRRATSRRRRAPSEVAALAERLYEAVCAHAGETMTVIAPHVGESARALNRPMTQLKRAGRVRSAGERSLTRYFPLSS